MPLVNWSTAGIYPEAQIRALHTHTRAHTHAHTRTYTHTLVKLQTAGIYPEAQLRARQELQKSRAPRGGHSSKRAQIQRSDTSYRRKRTFIKRGGSEGLAKRTKRWRNRSEKRASEAQSGGGEEEGGRGGGGGSSRIGKRAAPGGTPVTTDEVNVRNRFQRATDAWKALKKRSSTTVKWWG